MAERSDPLLRVNGVTKTFGGIVAVSDVSLEVERGESVGLVGPNGAGKTTLFNCICGQLRPEHGVMELDGVSLAERPTYKRARMGISRTYQRIEVFPDMTVRDHLVVAVRARWCTGRLWRDLFNMSSTTTEERDRVASVLELVGIGDQADVQVSTLGLGSCRLVELARALVCEPVLLLADEPSSGLDVHETRELSKVLRTLPTRTRTGAAAGRARSEHGRGGGRQDHRHEPGQRHRRGRLRRSDGRSGGPTGLPGVERVSTAIADPPALEVDHVSAAYGPYRALFDVTFSVPAAGVTALIGSNGAGKSTVARVVTGLLASTEGTLRLSGTDVTGRPAYRIARTGCAHVPEGRGIFANLTVEENLRVLFRQKLGKRQVPDALDRAYGSFPILGSRRKQHGGTLSGGEQRILSLAKVLVAPPRLLVADEISLGLAPVMVDAVYEGLRKINGAGTALLIVEQQVDRVLDIAGTAVVLEHGAVAYSGPADGAMVAVERVLASRGERAMVGVADPGGPGVPARQPVERNGPGPAAPYNAAPGEGESQGQDGGTDSGENR